MLLAVDFPNQKIISAFAATKKRLPFRSLFQGEMQKSLVGQLVPVQNSFFVKIKVAALQNQQERQQHKEQTPRAGQKDDSQRVEKCDFDIKNQEQHSDHVILDGITLVGRTGDVREAAFIGGTLDKHPFDFSGMQKPVGKEQEQGDCNGQNDENRHGKSRIKNLNVTHNAFKIVIFRSIFALRRLKYPWNPA